MKNLINLLLFIIVLYLYINNPLLTMTSGIGATKVLYPIAFFAIANYLYSFRKYSRIFRSEFAIFFYLILFSFLRFLIGGEITVVRSNIVAFVEILLLPFLLILWANRIGLKKDIIRAILIVGAIGATISSVCLAYAPFNLYIKNDLTVLPQDSFLLESTYRGFGLSEQLTYDYGIIQGLMLAIGFNYMKENKWFILFIPFVIISILFNARTGVIVAALSILVILIEKRKSSSLIWSIFVAYVIIVNISNLFSIINVSSEAIDWGLGVFDEMDEAWNSKSLEHGTAGTLLGEMFILPENLPQWLVGRGYFLAGKSNILGIHSDVGFINQINYGGLLYAIPLYLALASCVVRLWKSKEFSFALVFIVTFFIANLKGSYLPNTGGFRLIMLLYFYLISSYHYPKLKQGSNSLLQS